MIATIGYEKAELHDFLATLKLSGIETLVDIRDRAQSRRRGFSKTALSEALADEGIEYVHFRELGDPKEGREAARRGDFEQFRKIFGEVLKTPSAKAALKDIEVIASSRSVCLMCFERDEKTCHRKIVAAHLEKSLGEKARHLGVKGGAGRRPSIRRMHDLNQGAAPPV